MKITCLLLVATAAALSGACASQRHSLPATEARTQKGSTADPGYDDHNIARIQRGITTESDLLAWFGPPDRREVRPDGRGQLAWSLSPRTETEPGDSGMLNVSLASNGKVEAYSARRIPAAARRTVEFVEQTDADLRAQLAQWARDGWNVLSISKPLPQTDGTVHRKAVLSRSPGGAASGVGYDDREIAQIRQGKTREAELLAWFGSPESREVRSDGRARLAWKFASRTGGGPDHSGELIAMLAPDGKVESYSARRGPE